MESVVLILIIAICVISYQALQNEAFFQKYLFRVDDVLIHKEYYRLISSGFLHINYLHLGLNIWVLHSFGAFLMEASGIGNFIIVYFASLIGGSLLALYFHRNHGDYSAVGASGAVSGVVFACTLLDPFGHVLLFSIEELAIVSWLYGLLYIGITLWGIKTQWGNIGHEAHLGGAITGLVTMALLEPALLAEHGTIFLLLLVPTCIVLGVLIKHPQLIFADMSFSSLFKKQNKSKLRVAHKDEERLWEYQQMRKAKKEASKKEKSQLKLDAILDKINEVGYEQLSEAEKAYLKKYAEE